MAKHTSVTFTHRTSISIDGKVLYECPIEIHDEADLDNYNITREDCTTFHFGGTDIRTIYFYPTPNREFADFMWRELNRDHSARMVVTRCMVPGVRKVLRRCSQENPCGKCPYGKNPAEKQINVISFDQLTESGEKDNTETSAGNLTAKTGDFKILLDEIREELDKTDPRLMIALRGRCIHGYNAREIAAQLDCSLPRFYQLRNQALRLAKEFLEQD